MKIVLVRHPATVAPPGQCYGRLDVPLRPDVLATVPDIAAELAAHAVARVWTSPAIRCHTLADAVARLAEVALYVDERLREMDFGAWEGQPWDVVPRADLDRWATAPLAFAPPGGEAGGAFLARVVGAHAAIRAAGEDCVVVSHGGPLKVLAALIRREPPDLLAPAPAIGSIAVFVC